MSDPHRRTVLQLAHAADPPFPQLLARHAQAITAAGWTVETLILRGTLAADLAAAIPGGAQTLGASSRQLARQRGGLVRVLRERPRVPALLLAHRWKPLTVAMALARPWSRTHVVGVAHGFGLLDGIGRRVRMALAPARVRLAGVSPPVVDELRARTRRPVTLLPNTLDIAAFRATVLAADAARAALARLPLAPPLDGRLLVGCIGRLNHKKELPVLLEAFARLPGSAAHLVLVGDGSERAAIEARIAGRDLHGRVTLTGRVDGAARMVRAFDVLVLPSGAQEGFGMAALEAAAAGVPLIVSDAPGPAAIVTDRSRVFRAGDPADLAARLAALLDETPAARARIAEAGLGHVRQHFDQPRLDAAMAALLGEFDRR